MENEDYQTLVDNEQYLYQFCKSLAERLTINNEWHRFEFAAGPVLTQQLKDIVLEGDDPRIPA